MDALSGSPPPAGGVGASGRDDYAGMPHAALARRLAVPRLITLHEATSTLDVAHAAAEGGAPAGTVIVADRQTAGRGRHGRSWRSAGGAGVWLTIVERPTDADALTVLPIRLGLAAAPVLDAFATEAVRLKWPNDLYVGDAKLAGVLVEARWQAGTLAWIAIAVGVNVVAPTGVERATGLRPGTSRADVLPALVPALRAAAAARGPLSSEELDAYASRDLAVGRLCVEPVPGRVAGLRADGALLVRGPSGLQAAVAGSLTFAPEPA